MFFYVIISQLSGSRRTTSFSASKCKFKWCSKCTQKKINALYVQVNCNVL